MSLIGATNEERIWNYLKAAGLSDCGVAGLMGNLYAESGLIPTNLQNSHERKLGYTDAEYTAAVDNGIYTDFVRDGAGYGLAQWTYWSRKQALLAHAKQCGKSIGDLGMQLSFLIKELTCYPTVMTVLKTATTVKVASDKVLVDFERPADQSAAAKAKRAGYGQKYYTKFVTCSNPNSGKLTAKALAEKAIDVAKNHNTVYMLGVFGAPVTESVIAGKAKQYPAWYNTARQAAFRKLVGKGYFGFDCVCLIKGLLWGWAGDESKTYGGASYRSNGVPDINADAMIRKCQDVSETGWDSMEVGEALWCSGHIGIYIGDGLAVECTPSWKNKVQITAVKNIGAKAGYNARKWVKHGKLPYVTYDGSLQVSETHSSSASAPSKEESTTVYTVVKGDSLWGIAAKKLGSGVRYKEIMELNKLTSSRILVGQKLKLP